MDYYYFALWINIMLFAIVRVIGAYYFLQKRLNALQVDKL